MASDEDLMRHMQGLVQQATMMQHLQSAANAYDVFASTALAALMRNPAVADSNSHDLAGKAWTIADAMMVQRQGRGLGGFDPPVQTDSLSREEIEELAKGKPIVHFPPKS